MTLLTEETGSLKEYGLEGKGGVVQRAIVKTQCRCGTSMILKDIEVVLSSEYVNTAGRAEAEWHRKGTYLKSQQKRPQVYMRHHQRAGLPQRIIFSYILDTESRGC